MSTRVILIALSLFGLCACSTPRSEPLPLFGLSPAALGSTLSTAQHLVITFDGATMATDLPPALDTLLEVQPDRLRLAALAWGKRILTLEWDGVQLQTQRHIPLPAQLDEKRILRDIQLAYWPLPALQAALPKGWTLQDDGTQRRLLWQGEPMVTVRNQMTPPWLGRTELHNHKEGYRLTLDNLQTESPAP